MTAIKATLQGYRQAPRKVRLMADLIRGKTVTDATTALKFAPKRAADVIEKLLASAVANAKNLNIESAGLIVKEITVNGGTIMYRRRPMSRGRPFPIRKRTSHISITLDESVNAKKLPKIKKEKTTKSTK